MPSRLLITFFIALAFLLTPLSVLHARSPQPKTQVEKKPAKTKGVDQKKKKVAAQKGVLAKAVYCIDLKNNETVLSRNADAQLPVASLTKLVTAMVAMERLTLDTKVTVPDHIKSVPKSVVGLKAGDKVTVEALLHGLLIGSGNDCAETLASTYPGGRAAFIQAMNKKVRKMGMTKTRFFTPSGLDRKTDDGDTKDGPEVESNVSSAKEIAAIAKTAFEHPLIREVSLKKSYVIPSETEKNGYPVRTTNKLLRDNLPLMGGKTGYTVRAGHCLASEFRPGKHIFLIVVLGSPDHFRDTRLVYHKALKETNRIKPAATGYMQRRAAMQP